MIGFCWSFGSSLKSPAVIFGMLLGIWRMCLTIFSVVGLSWFAAPYIPVMVMVVLFLYFIQMVNALPSVSVILYTCLPTESLLTMIITPLPLGCVSSMVE